MCGCEPWAVHQRMHAAAIGTAALKQPAAPCRRVATAGSPVAAGRCPGEGGRERNSSAVASRQLLGLFMSRETPYLTHTAHVVSARVAADLALNLQVLLLAAWLSARQSQLRDVQTARC